MKSLFQDLRYGLRVLTKSPGFSVVAVLILALGIGANTVVFSVVYGMALSPLGYPDQDSLVAICDVCPAEGETCSSISIPDFVDWRRESNSFADMGVCGYASVNLTGGDRPERLGLVITSANLLSLLGFEAQIGRGFGTEDVQPGTEAVVVLSHSLWRRRFAADAGAVGSTMLLDKEPHTVIGVLPQAFEQAWGRSDIWSPSAFNAEDFDRSNRSFFAYGRLRPGVSAPQARTELQGIAAGLAEVYPQSNAGRSATVVGVVDRLLGVRGKLILYSLAAAVGFVLLVACANVASLALTRANTRTREFAVRAALGASRWRLLRQTVTECAILATTGGLAGFLLAVWGVDAVVRLLPDSMPRRDEIGLDPHVLLFALFLTLASALLFGLGPAFQSARPNLGAILKDDPGSTSGTRRWHSRGEPLLVGQVALAFALMICAGLMIQSFVRLTTVTPGFDAHRLLTMRITLPSDTYNSDAKRVAFFNRALEEIRERPGIKLAAGALAIPLDGWNNWTNVTVEGYVPPDPQTRTRCGFVVVTPRYFETMGIPMFRGRDFDLQDDGEHKQVVIVSEGLADRFWPHENPIGKRLRYGASDSTSPWLTVIGVVGNIKKVALSQQARMETYRPYAQTPRAYMAVVARTSGNPLVATRTVERAIWSVDHDLPTYSVRSMENIIFRHIGMWSIAAKLLGAFAVLALLMAAAGLYATVSYAVTQRTREFGIRVALGAQTRDVLRLVYARYVVLTLLGIGAGAVLALLLGSALRSLVYGVTPTDPATFMGVGIVMIVVAVLAGYGPARRAAKVDPMVALKCE